MFITREHGADMTGQDLLSLGFVYRRVSYSLYAYENSGRLPIYTPGRLKSRATHYQAFGVELRWSFAREHIHQ
jgi:hypothetical protein